MMEFTYSYLFVFMLKTVSGLTDDWTQHAQSSWNHNTQDKNGPGYWNETWPDCSGKKQSPINIDPQHVWYSSTLTAMEMIGYDSIPPGAHWELYNAGHSIQLMLIGDYRIRDGGLPGVYKAVHMDFHWGAANKVGSEHSIDGKKFALELQILHYNMKYKSLEAAVAYEDGLAIVSFLVKVGNHRNPAFSQIVNNLSNITHRGSKVALRPIPIFSVLPVNMNNYYRYTGSLTMPPCLEVVLWTVIADVAEISEKQLTAFHNFRTHLSSESEFKLNPRQSRRMDRSHSLIQGTTGNCRPLQPLGDRTVYSSDPNDANILTSPFSSLFSVVIALCLGFLIMLFVINRPIKGDDGEFIQINDSHED